MKRQGPIWLGLTDSVHSLRPYPGFGDIRRMVARSAYDQLNYSPLLLAGTVIGMTLTYLMPPLLAVWGTGLAQGAGALTWALMTAAFYPIVRFYKLLAALGCGTPCHRRPLYAIHARLGAAALARQGRALERARAGAPCGGIMITGPVWDPGEKTHRDENFPVASDLVSKKHRAVDPRPSTASRAPPTTSRTIPLLTEAREDRRARRVRGDAARAE